LVIPGAYQWRADKHVLQELQMVAAASLISVIAGAAFAYAADRYPAYVEKFQTAGGVLLVAGLMLIGAAIPQA